MRYLVAFLLCLIAPCAYADDEVVIDNDMQKQIQIRQIKDEIDELEMRLSECRRKNKNWKIATAIGATGTVATGVAAIAQTVKLNKLKKAGKIQDKPTETGESNSEKE